VGGLLTRLLIIKCPIVLIAVLVREGLITIIIMEIIIPIQGVAILTVLQVCKVTVPKPRISPPTPNICTGLLAAQEEVPAMCILLLPLALQLLVVAAGGMVTMAPVAAFLLIILSV
jgi:hypothetical protein